MSDFPSHRVLSAARKEQPQSSGLRSRVAHQVPIEHDPQSAAAGEPLVGELEIALGKETGVRSVRTNGDRCPKLTMERLMGS